MCLKLISFIFLIIFLFAYPFVWSQSQSDSFYLPLAIGNQWIYESENNYFADTLTVVDTQSVDGKLYYAIQQDSYDLYLWFREENRLARFWGQIDWACFVCEFIGLEIQQLIQTEGKTFKLADFFDRQHDTRGVAFAVNSIVTDT